MSFSGHTQFNFWLFPLPILIQYLCVYPSVFTANVSETCSYIHSLLPPTVWFKMIYWRCILCPTSVLLPLCSLVHLKAAPNCFFSPSICRHFLICFLLDVDFSFCLFTCILLPLSYCPLKHLYGWDGKESACNAGDSSLIPGLGRSPEERNGNPPSILAWRIPRPEKPGRLQSMGLQSQAQLSD